MTTQADLDALGFGIAVGHATDPMGATGCTVIRGVRDPFRASVAILGRATGTRELALLDPAASNERVDAILLTGGSAYGLDAASGVMQWLEREGRGFPIAGGVVPIVPAAVVFDLAPLGSFAARPTPAMAFDACAVAGAGGPIAEGSVGVGAGCTVGKVRGPSHAMKGGFGVATSGDPRLAAAAFVGVNAFGDVRDGAGRLLAGPRADDGAILETEAILRTAPRGANGASGSAAANTTIAVVALNVALTKSELAQVARAATGALHRRIRPAGTSYDGDVVFAIAPLAGHTGSLIACEAHACAALESAIERGVRTAVGRDGIPGLAD